MNLQRILNSRKAGKYALRLSQAIPPKIGMFVCQSLANWIGANRELPLTQAIRLNRWVVSGCSLTSQQLDQAQRANLLEIAYSHYLLFHYFNRPEALQRNVYFTPEVEVIIENSREKRRGIVVAGLHMSNFDLVMQAAAWRGMKALAISIPDSSENIEAVEWQHQIRRHSGLEIRPASYGTFKQAIRRLREGETVLTGIDRPIPSPKYKPIFFGFPANLPSHHIHLALETDVPIILLAAIRASDGIYHLESTPEIRLRKFQDRSVELTYNTEHLLEHAADFIRKAPDQWDVLLPVWPEIQTKMP